MLSKGTIACCLLLLSYCDLAEGRGLPEITNDDSVSTSVDDQGDVDRLLTYQAQQVEDDGGQAKHESAMTLRKIQDQLVLQNETLARERTEVARERKEVSALKETLTAALMKMGKGTRRNQPVAFTAYLSHELHTKPGHPLRFDKVLYNPGSGMYDMTTGAATIKVSGTYLFTLTIEHYTDTGSPIHCHLVVDGVKQVDVIIDPKSKSTQSSNTAVIGLKRGQKVWVVTNEGKLYGETTFHGTTFAGVLIYR